MFGALVAVIGTIWVALHRDKQAAAHERREALVAFYAANSLAHAWTAWNEMRHETGTGTVGSIRLGLRMSGSTNLVLTRVFGLTDAFWHSSAHAMSVLDGEAQKIVFDVELAVGEWTFDGTPAPER